MEKCVLLIIFSCLLWVSMHAQSAIITNQQQANQQRTIALQLEETEDWDKAISIYKELISFYQKGNNNDQWLKAHIDLLKAYRLKGDYDSAKKVMENCLKSDLFNKIQTSLLKAVAYHQHGITLYQLDFYKKAKNYFQLALEIRKQQIGIDTTLLIKGYHNIGNCNKFLGKYDLALNFLDSALQLNSSYKIDTVRLATTYEVMAQVYIEKKEFDQAENHLFIALVYFQDIYRDEPWLLADFYENITFFYDKFNIPDKVIEFSLKRLEIYSNIEDKEPSDFFGIANSFNSLGAGYQIQKNYPLALSFYRKALRINQKFPIERLGKQAFNWNNIGLIHKLQGNYQQAILAYNNALNIKSNNITKQDKSDFHYNLGKTYYELDDYQRALDSYQKAIILITHNFNNKDYYQNPSINSELVTDKLSLTENLWEKAKTLAALAQKENQLKNLQTAQATYALIEQLLTQIRADFEADKSKAFLIEKARKIYEDALNNTWQLYQLTKTDTLKEKMLHLAEQSKALILLDAFKDLEAKKTAGVAPALLQQEQDLKAKISELAVTIADKEETITIESDTELLQLRQTHLDTKATLEKVVQQMEQQNPQYYQLKNQQNNYDIATIQTDLLQPDQSIIEYLLTDTLLYAFVLFKADITIHQIPIDFPIKDWIDQFRKGIYGDFETNAPTESTANLNDLYVKYSHQLYEKLIAPLGELSSKIIIIPDGILGFLPFDALLKETPSSKDFYQMSFLGYDHQLSYGFSIQALMEVTKSKNKGNGQWLGFAPSFASDIQMIVRNSRSSLGPLLHNQEEVEKVSDLMSSNLPPYLHLSATKETFLAQAPPYSYLHLSSHAMMNDKNPDNSFIAFTQTNQQLDSSQLLYVRDLYNQSLNADMVVLSACETGIGKIYQGEGLISLARAFTYAGAKSIITTLWKVNDRSTTQLMIDFYRELIQEKDKDEALWLAKRQMVDQGIYAHPYYWAGFIPLGNMSAIEMGYGVNWWWIGGGALIIGFLLIFFFKKSKR